MKAVTIDNFRSLLAGYEPPCVSVYMTTDPHRPGGARDHLRLKNLLRTAVRELERSYARADAVSFVEPLAEAFDSGSARRAGAGLALLRSPEVAIRYALPVPVPELAVVASTFHTKPLLSYLARDRHFFVLALSERTARLYEASPLVAAEAFDARLPSGIEEATRELRDVDPYRGVHGAVGASGATHRRGTDAVTHARKERLARYFKAVDERLCAFLRDRGAPLVLAGVGTHHALYRRVTRYPHVLDVGIEGNVDHLRADEIHRLAWPIVEEQEAHREASAVAQYVAARSSGKTSDDLADVARAVVEGRVRVLLHAEGAHVWGHLDRETGECQLDRAGETRGFARADIIDDLCELTLLRGGDVIEVAPVRMPSVSPAAAINRY
jgi:release factor family 3